MGYSKVCQHRTLFCHQLLKENLSASHGNILHEFQFNKFGKKSKLIVKETTDIFRSTLLDGKYILLDRSHVDCLISDGMVLFSNFFPYFEFLISQLFGLSYLWCICNLYLNSI